MGASEKQRLALACLFTAMVVSGFWWYGLDFAIREKISIAEQRAENVGYSRAIGDGRHGDKYLRDENVRLIH